MWHEIFARSIVFVGRVHAQICNLASIEASKSLDLRNTNETHLT